LAIKKYPNRRYYDTSRSRHVTLGELHDLICDDYELTITDSKTGDDITRQVLTQIILERDPLKLAIFPTNILHQVIRTQKQFLGSVVEQFFQQALQTHKTSQERWAGFLRNTLGMGATTPTSPLEWTRPFMDAFGAPAPAPDNRREESDPRDRQIDELMSRIEDLSRRVEQAEGRAEQDPSSAPNDD
jgi:polyhydroxyalkanoate synthesis repressor PhaR